MLCSHTMQLFPTINKSDIYTTYRKIMPLEIIKLAGNNYIKLIKPVAERWRARFLSFVVPVIFTVTQKHICIFIRRIAVRLSGESIKRRIWGHVDMFNIQCIRAWNFKLKNWKWGRGGGSVGKMVAGQAWRSEFGSTIITEKPGVIEYTCNYSAGRWVETGGSQGLRSQLM